MATTTNDCDNNDATTNENVSTMTNTATSRKGARITNDCDNNDATTNDNVLTNNGGIEKRELALQSEGKS